MAIIPFIVLLDKTKGFFTIINGNYLSLTGGELRGPLAIGGRLSVSNDQSSDLALEKQSGDKAGYTIRRFSDNLYIYQSKNDVTADKYIAMYNRSHDTWDFNTTGLTKNTVPVATENQILGVGQKWFNMTSKRKNNVEYKNNTGKVIALSLWQSNSPDTPNSNVFIDGPQVTHNDWTRGGNIVFTLVPPAAYIKPLDGIIIAGIQLG